MLWNAHWNVENAWDKYDDYELSPTTRIEANAKPLISKYDREYEMRSSSIDKIMGAYAEAVESGRY